ncbi:MAG: glycosyltransferase family 4 protein [Candidatus Omnitrophica bacterium]|nr:glycosyltransferase family 4 protein [Candidatus Omnitrophota bacterium]MDD5429597.1 glycosyltransferase family 4 protein [Candidatus Omnitrophota bacterium]
MIPKRNILVFDHMLVIDSYKLLYKKLIGCYGVNLLAICPSYAVLNFRNNRRINSTIKDNEKEWIKKIRPIVPMSSHRVFYNPLKIIKILKKVSWDLIYINGEPDWLLSTEIIFLSKLLRMKSKILVHTSRSIDFTITGFPYRFPGITRCIDYYVRKNCDALICVGRTTKESFEKSPFSFKHNKLYALPWYFDVNFYKSHRSKKKNISIGYVGRVEDEKGIITFWEAVKKLDNTIDFIIAGNGSRADWLRKEIEAMNVKCKFIRDASPEDMPKIYSEIDILIVPSLTTRTWREHFGRVIPEAMACEAAVIGSDSGEIPFVIDGAGLVFKEGDPADLLAKINLLINDQGLLEELRKKGRRRVCEKFSVEAVATQFYKIIEDTLN